MIGQSKWTSQVLAMEPTDPCPAGRRGGLSSGRGRTAAVLEGGQQGTISSRRECVRLRGAGGSIGLRGGRRKRPRKHPARELGEQENMCAVPSGSWRSTSGVAIVTASRQGRGRNRKQEETRRSSNGSSTEGP
uniref:(northern house mosquito) hypothetical protein n=1 Tax=Culex pipiens TaxID=7175 RepID=A0A8D8IRA1_CULPI